MEAHRHARGMSRREFMRVAGAAGGVAIGAGAFGEVAAAGERLRPVPIPGGIELGGELFHLFLPGPGNEPSTITNFTGAVGVSVVDGRWEVAEGRPKDGVRRGQYEADIRFMKGLFRGADGAFHQAAFGFV
jgi:hypothetical protein